MKIQKETKALSYRTIDPWSGFDITGETITLYSFSPYKSTAHNVKASVDILQQDDTALLIKVESIDWSRHEKFPFTTQGCFLVQETTEKYNKKQLSVDRVPCSCETIQDAVDFLTPAEVKRADTVLRQGDFFFIKMKKRSNFSALRRSRHDITETKRGIVIRHPEHKALSLPTGPWKAVQRKTMNVAKAD